MQLSFWVSLKVMFFFLDFHDGMVTAVPEVEIRMRLISLIRQIKPSVCMSWFPYPRYQLLPSKFGDLGYHPDHQAVGKLTIDAVFGASLSRMFPEIGLAWQTREFYMWSFTNEMTHYVNVTKTSLDMKIKSYLAHKTQVDSDAAVAKSMYSLASFLSKFTLQPSILYSENFQAYC